MCIKINQEIIEKYIRELGIDGNNIKDITEKLVSKNKKVEEEIQSLQELKLAVEECNKSLKETVCLLKNIAIGGNKVIVK